MVLNGTSTMVNLLSLTINFNKHLCYRIELTALLSVRPS